YFVLTALRGREVGAERLVRVGDSAITATANDVVPIDQHRVAPVRSVDYLSAEGVQVVRTAQPQRGVRIDGQVHQCLVQLALDDLLGSAPGPHRLDNSAYRPRMLLDELLPDPDDPRRIPAENRHVHEVHACGVTFERVLEQAEPFPGDGDHTALVPSNRLLDERHDA